MFRLLILWLVWLSSTKADGDGSMRMMASDAMMSKMSMMDPSMLKEKRDSFPHVASAPCPPFYPHVPAHVQQPLFIRPYYGPPNYPKKEVTVHQLSNQIKYIHQPAIYNHQQQAVIPKQTVTYLKPEAASVNFQTGYNSVQQLHQPLIVKPVQYAVTEPKIAYQKPVYPYAPIYYNKPMYEVPKPYVNKIIYQKPSILYKPISPAISYGPIHQPKVVEIQQPISYLKLQQPMIHHHSAPIYLPPVHQPKASPIIALNQPCD